MIFRILDRVQLSISFTKSYLYT